MNAGRKETVPDFVRLHAQKQPDAVALVEALTGRTLRYDAADHAVASAVTVLRSLGIEPGGRIAALARNSVELVILQLACTRAGAILAPLNWRLSAPELQLLLEDCDPALLVVDDMVERLAQVALPILTVDAFRSQLEVAPPAPFEAGDAERPSLMLYTSGTSGKPKGVPLSESNMFATALNSLALLDISAKSAFLADSPMFHIIGMVTNIRPALMAGGRIVVSDGFKPEVTVERLGDPALGITHYFCVPQMAAMLRAAPNFDPGRLHGMKGIFTGGAPQTAAQIREWLDDGIPIVDGYGMTEAGTVLGMPIQMDMIARKAGSAGLPAPTIECRIRDSDDRECGPDEVGELLLRGPSVCDGYWRNPGETRQAFTEDGFFRTGDLVRRDEDGYFFLVGRLKDMYITGGENVYPVEVEAILKSHPDVADAAVVGVADSRWGEIGHAFLVLKANAMPDEASLRALCEQSLARYKHPSAIHFIATMPRTGSGKIAKAELAQLIPS